VIPLKNRCKSLSIKRISFKKLAVWISLLSVIAKKIRSIKILT
jgi:hypothetical protein